MRWHRSHSLLMAIGLCLAASPVEAKEHRPDADGFPCAQRGRLAVNPDGQGFSIGRRSLASDIPSAVSTLAPVAAVAIGDALRLDPIILGGRNKTTGGVDHDPRR